MSRSDDYIQNALQAGKCAQQVRAYGISLIVTGASYNEVIEKIIAKITELGCEPAFPPQIALNDVAAHYLPMPGEDIIFSDQVCSLDIGVSYKGAIGDCAASVDLSGKHANLITASREALLAAQNILRVGLPIREIGRAITETIEKHGCVSVKNLCGHGVDEFVIHTDPSIPNYDNGNENTLQPGMTFAIEPFASTGAGLIYDAGGPTIFSFVAKRPVRSPITKEVLKKVLAKNGLPFSMHELIDAKTPAVKVKYALNDMMRSGIIQGHAPLVDEKHGMVSQAENTIVIDMDGTVHISTESE